MKTLHTPAPWTVGSFVDTRTDKRKWEKGYFPINSPVWGQFVICYRHEINESREEAEANARLIAAAPELLQMLIELNNAIDDYWNSEMKPDILVRHINMKQKQAFQLISKATGESLTNQNEQS